MHDLRPDQLDAPPYIVRCVEEDSAAGEGHEHVVAVETRDPDGGETRWSTVQVLAAVREGERFVIGDEADERLPSLVPARCPRCAIVTLSVSPSQADIARCR
jgi:hypothetical protein